MRAGTILRTVGVIIFLAGLILGIVIVAGAQSLLITFTTNTNLASAIMWGIAIYVWVSSAILACLIFTVGTMSNNLDDIYFQMEDVQSNTQGTTEALRHIVYMIDKRILKERPSVEPNRTESNAQHAPSSNIRSKSSSTDV